VTLIVHHALAVRVVPQLLVWEKSPLAAMLEMVSVALPGLLSVTLSEPLLVPKACAENVKEVGDRLAAGAVPVPDKLAL